MLWVSICAGGSALYLKFEEKIVLTWVVATLKFYITIGDNNLVFFTWCLGFCLCLTNKNKWLHLPNLRNLINFYS